MKWFYVISLLIVGLLAASPFVLLSKPEQGRFAGKVVSYNTYGAKVKSVDPATCGDTTSSGMQGNVFEGLYAYHYLKRPVEVIPLLAAALPTVSPDALTYTIPLKKGVEYAPNPCFGMDEANRPLTRTVRADDLVLAFKRIADYHLTTKLSLAFIEDRIVGLKKYREKTKTYRKGDFTRYEKEELPGVRAIDEHTLEIRLTRPFPQLLYVLAMHVYAPIPHELIEYHLATEPSGNGNRKPVPMNDRDPEIRTIEAMVGTGPYRMTEWIEGSRIVFERNERFRKDYYPTEGGPGDEAAGLLKDAGKQVPFVDVRSLIFVQEDDTAWRMFRSGQRDVAGIPRDVYAQVISPTKELAQTWEKRGIRLVKSTYPAIYWLAFNMADPVVGKSKSLRQALCLSFDVETYVEVIFNGRGTRAVNTIPSDFKGHKEAGPGPYAHLDLTLARRKIKLAKEELVAAGVIGEGDDIPELTLDMPGTDEQSRRVGEFAQGQFQQVGVRVKIEMNDWPTLQKKVHNKQTQMYAMGWHADYPDAENFLQLYYSPNIELGTNNTNYRNPKFDKLFEQAGILAREEDRIPLYAEMIRMVSEDCPVLLLTEPISFVLLYDWVGNYKPHPVGYGFGKYTRIDAALRRKMGGGRAE